MDEQRLPHLIIIGGGFGGLYAAREAARLPMRVTVIDRKNHHTFQPLLYQVAAAVLSPADIAYPIRGVLRHKKNVVVLLEEATGFDLDRRMVKLRDGEMAYDYLIVAAGATHSYFGHDEWEPFAPGLKSLEDALEIRRRVLLAYELAERRASGEVIVTDRGPAESQPPVQTPPTPPPQKSSLNFVVIGGGPTGVELAGALADIARYALTRDFRAIDPASSRVILLEGGPRVLPTYPEDLSRSAEEQLRGLGVEVHTNSMVTKIEPGIVHVGETVLPSAVTLWAAGVAASSLGRQLGVPTDRAGRVLVEPDLSIPGHPEVFVIGDLASIKQADGKPVPGVAPAAIQMGRAAARNIGRTLAGKPREAFHYRDKGSLATIGRAAGVAQLGKIHIGGLVAWLMWLFVHIFFLIGFRNRLLVMFQWAWAYCTHRLGIRLITGSTDLPGSE